MAQWLMEIKGVGSIIENEDASYADKVERLAKLLRESKWYAADGGEDGELERLIEDLEMCDEDSGDYSLGLIYDRADEQRVWLDPMS